MKLLRKLAMRAMGMREMPPEMVAAFGNMGKSAIDNMKWTRLLGSVRAHRGAFSVGSVEGHPLPPPNGFEQPEGPKSGVYVGEWARDVVEVLAEALATRPREVAKSKVTLLTPALRTKLRAALNDKESEVYSIVTHRAPVDAPPPITSNTVVEVGQALSSFASKKRHSKNVENGKDDDSEELSPFELPDGEGEEDGELGALMADIESKQQTVPARELARSPLSARALPPGTVGHASAQCSSATCTHIWQDARGRYYMLLDVDMVLQWHVAMDFEDALWPSSQRSLLRRYLAGASLSAVEPEHVEQKQDKPFQHYGEGAKRELSDAGRSPDDDDNVPAAVLDAERRAFAEHFARLKKMRAGQVLDELRNPGDDDTSNEMLTEWLGRMPKPFERDMTPGLVLQRRIRTNLLVRTSHLNVFGELESHVTPQQRELMKQLQQRASIEESAHSMQALKERGVMRLWHEAKRLAKQEAKRVEKESDLLVAGFLDWPDLSQREWSEEDEKNLEEWFEQDSDSLTEQGFREFLGEHYERARLVPPEEFLRWFSLDETALRNVCAFADELRDATVEYHNKNKQLVDEDSEGVAVAMQLKMPEKNDIEVKEVHVTLSGALSGSFDVEFAYMPHVQSFASVLSSVMMSHNGKGKHVELAKEYLRRIEAAAQRHGIDVDALGDDEDLLQEADADEKTRHADTEDDGEQVEEQGEEVGEEQDEEEQEAEEVDIESAFDVKDVDDDNKPQAIMLPPSCRRLLAHARSAGTPKTVTLPMAMRECIMRAPVPEVHDAMLKAESCGRLAWTDDETDLDIPVSANEFFDKLKFGQMPA